MRRRFSVLMAALVSPLCLVVMMSACQNGAHKSSDEAHSDSTVIAPLPESSKPERPAPAAPISDRVITPGTSIGQTFLEEHPDTLIAILGKPDYQDAAMGKAWLTWFGKKRDEHNNQTELNVFLTYQDSTMREKVVRQIRTTSSWFLLQDSIHVYSAFSQIKNAFPDIKYSGKYTEDGRQLRIYDDLDQGVAFETVTAAGQTLCTAILVHVPGTPLNSVYFPIHGDQGKP